MTTPFESTDQFLELFEIGPGSNYHDQIIFTDTKVGFSIKRYYPGNIRYKPAVRDDDNKTPDNVVTIWVAYSHPDETKRAIDLNKVPIRVRVSNMSLYRTHHFDYNYADPNCPAEESVELSATTPKPIDLEYNNHFFYSHDNNVFMDEYGNELTGNGILDRAYNDHCDTVHPLKSLSLRFKLFAQAKGNGTLGLLITFLSYILKTLFGRTLEDDDKFSTALYRGYKKGSLKKLNEDSLNVFGYKAAKPVIIVFCFLVFVVSLVRYYLGISGGYLSFIASNNAKSITHGILTLWILDAVIPNIIFILINIIIKLRTALMFRKFKFKNR